MKQQSVLFIPSAQHEIPNSRFLLQIETKVTVLAVTCSGATAPASLSGARQVGHGLGARAITQPMTDFQNPSRKDDC